MSVLRQLNLLGQQRLDVPHLRGLESSIAADFDVLAGRVQAGGRPLVIRGFTLANTAAGTAATAIQLSTADGIVYNMHASEAGTFLWVPADRALETLNSATNARIRGGFTAGQVNYIGLDFIRSADDTTTDLVQFLDPNTLLEQPKSVPLARTLDYRIVISTTPFSANSNIIPVAKVKTNNQNQVDSASGSVEDARNLMWRLGSGGDFPDIYGSFSWPQDRLEYDPNVGALASLEKFSGGDKALQSQKDWMDAVMMRLWEVGGGQNWYSPTADRNVKMTKAAGVVFGSTADNFEWVAGLYASNHLHWQGLKIVFENANVTGVYYNSITDQLVDDAAGSAALSKTALAVGDCIYVDLDRTANATVTAQKAAIQTLGVPTRPGSRIILAWRDSGGVYVRDSSFPVNTSFSAATTVAIGAVRLAYVAGTPATPTVPPLDANNSISVGTGSYTITGNNSAIIATGGGTGSGVTATGGSTGIGVRGFGGAGANTSGVYGEAGGAGTLGATAYTHIAGVYGRGRGTLAGIIGLGGAANSIPGGFFEGSDGYNSHGLEARGKGTESGSQSYGGATGPTGGAGFFSTQANGAGARGFATAANAMGGYFRGGTGPWPARESDTALLSIGLLGVATENSYGVVGLATGSAGNAGYFECTPSGTNVAGGGGITALGGKGGSGSNGVTGTDGSAGGTAINAVGGAGGFAGSDLTITGRDGGTGGGGAVVAGGVGGAGYNGASADGDGGDGGGGLYAIGGAGGAEGGSQGAPVAGDGGWGIYGVGGDGGTGPTSNGGSGGVGGYFFGGEGGPNGAGGIGVVATAGIGDSGGGAPALAGRFIGGHVQVDGSKQFTYNTAVERWIHVSPDEFHPETGPALLDATATDPNIYSPTGSPDVYLARVRVPRGAVVGGSGGIEIAASNTDLGGPRSITVSMQRRTYQAVGATAYTNTNLLSAASVAVAITYDAGADQDWYAVSAGSAVSVSEGFIVVRVEIPATTSTGQVRLYGLRIKVLVSAEDVTT